MAARTSVAEFRELVNSSTRILALCGAGLSAASGLPTFRGAGGLWRNHQPTSLATPEAFEADPALVWLFYAWRRHMALKARPNRGHYALAELAKKKDGFLCLTQNVDGLSPRAGHPESKLRLLHGSLLDIKCYDECGYVDRNNLDDPVCPALAPAAEDYPPDKTLPLLDPNVPVPPIKVEDLPHCPNCKTGLLRPGVVWFGEALDEPMLREVDVWVVRGKIDLMLVVGTAAAVYPAAGYTRQAKKMGATVAVVNPDPGSAEGLRSTDFFFQGDAAEILPQLFEGVIGKMDENGQIGLPVALCYLLASAARDGQKLLAYSVEALGITLLMNLSYRFPVASVVATLVLRLAQAAVGGYANGGWGTGREATHLAPVGGASAAAATPLPGPGQAGPFGRATPAVCRWPWSYDTEAEPCFDLIFFSMSRAFCALRGETVALGGGYGSRKPSDAGVLRKPRARRLDRIVMLSFLASGHLYQQIATTLSIVSTDVEWPSLRLLRRYSIQFIDRTGSSGAGA
ncbi:hypothetical protein DL771_002396 [Monosporascus sp. 5C6A]|nr:hypothetical protein DL771_002396 [Monosporascus sp. 5C6A]